MNTSDGLQASDQRLRGFAVSSGVLASVCQDLHQPFSISTEKQLSGKEREHHGVSSGVIQHRHWNRSDSPL